MCLLWEQNNAFSHHREYQIRQVIMFFYGLPSALMFVLLLRDFCQDSSTPMTDIDSWFVLVTAAAIWPIAGVFRFRKSIERRLVREEDELSLTHEAV